MLSLIGFSGYDALLIVGCVIGAMMGSFAYAVMDAIDVKAPKALKDASFATPELVKLRGAWLYLRIMLGGILGVVIGLYFVGSLHETGTAFAKVIALAIIGGYAAPQVWAAQGNAVSKKIEQLQQPNK